MADAAATPGKGQAAHLPFTIFLILKPRTR